jgi:hypothetical protein
MAAIGAVVQSHFFNRFQGLIIMSNNQVKINKAFGGILSIMSESDLKNAYFGGSNILANLINDYSQDGINEYIGEWLDDHLNKPYNVADISAHEIISNPDYLVQYAASEFHSGLYMLFPWQDKQGSEHVMRNAKYDLSSGCDKFYIYANPWSNACCTFYIISADNESEALETLTDKFAVDFDDDGMPDYDNLQYIGMIDAS